MWFYDITVGRYIVELIVNIKNHALFKLDFFLGLSNVFSHAPSITIFLNEVSSSPSPDCREPSS